ncbi:hypothetical protein [Rubinisphaera brasiliensis]|uniref:Uncharacterized protein n=1 Tax=Rubinisphaera brasiliensis (strain ATCC 49424 / DSM 5305 / JCM 21570 / IAM 15109 / NBRC 103401 / IFAM 1448) TaxID=756272 RepID=F0SNI9_RUBBR|nr:hypothetical protein [Rubinisphaera brasiliensis]ADY57823.1 hypothetical protein Plabr_0193 [Rubinisphaera brasiliensis DSM 5305]
MRITRDQFQQSIIAQADDEDYEESGYVACVFGDLAMIGHYSHCSCFATFEALCGGGISDWFDEGEPSWDWSGSVDELKSMAERWADPAMPDREADESDYDYCHLVSMYKQVQEHFDAHEVNQ